MYILAHAVSAQTTTQPDYIALAMVAVMALAVVIMVIRKHAELQKKAAQTNNTEVTANATVVKTASTATAPGSAGPIKIYDVEPKTAAMVMAIVAEKTGKPLNELRFISIKEVK